jgi:hypothetical protein
MGARAGGGGDVALDLLRAAVGGVERKARAVEDVELAVGELGAFEELRQGICAGAGIAKGNNLEMLGFRKNQASDISHR